VLRAARACDNLTNVILNNRNIVLSSSNEAAASSRYLSCRSSGNSTLRDNVRGKPVNLRTSNFAIRNTHPAATDSIEVGRRFVKLNPGPCVGSPLKGFLMPLSRLLRSAATGVVLATVANCMWASTSRITGAVDPSTVVALAGGVSPRAMAAKDLGAAAGDRRLGSMSLRFSMTAGQQRALTQLLADQQNPASPRYRQWLTPEQYGAQFGLSAEDIGKVGAWLTGQGFTVTEVARGGSFVRFSGSVAQAEAAFHTEIHNVLLDGETHLANLTAPELPAAIAAVTLGVTGLDDFRPKAQYHESLAGKAGGVVQPEYTSAGQHYLAPGDFYTIYDEKGLFTSKITGTGVTIAVIGQSDISPSDIAAFQSLSGLANNPPTVQLYGGDPGFPDIGDQIQADQDIEWAGAAAPGASIVYVNSTSVLDGSLTEAIDNDVASILDISYGGCEASFGTGPLAFYSQLLAEGSAEGISIIAEAGGLGATDCDHGSSATQGLAVEFPGSSPQVTGVGGTEFNEGTGNYWSATNGSNGGSALSYIPEVVYNDDNSTAVAAGGGGASLYYPKPAWQTGNGVPSDYSRDVPDVSLSASYTHDGYLICSNGSCASGFGSSGSLNVGGVPSIGSAAFAGLMALVEQKTGGKPMGNASPVIYALANSTYAGSVFHDITSGTNASPCTKGSVGCPTGGTIGYAATAGYDQASGWGSVDAYALVNDWALVTPVTTTTGAVPTFTSLAGSANSVTAGTSIVFTVTVASATSASTTTPTGMAEITINGVGAQSVSLVSGTVTYTLNTTTMPAGTYAVQATYFGDSTYAGSKGEFNIIVAATGAPDFALSPTATTVTVASGSVSPAVTFTVTELNGFVGNVAFMASVSAALNATCSFTITPVALSSTSTTGSTALTLLAYTVNARGGLGAAAASKPAVRGTAGWYRGGPGVVLAGVLLLLLPRRRRLSGLLVVLLSVAALGVLGCTSPPIRTAGSDVSPTTPGTYTVLVSATGVMNGVTSSHSSTVTFVVQ